MIESQEIIEHFIGRQAELAEFQHWLTNRDPEAPRILYFYDHEEVTEKKGGVGKTWLLSACDNLAHTLYPDIVIVHVDFFNVEIATPSSLRTALLTHSKKPSPIGLLRS